MTLGVARVTVTLYSTIISLRGLHTLSIVSFRKTIPRLCIRWGGKMDIDVLSLLCYSPLETCH